MQITKLSLCVDEIVFTLDGTSANRRLIGYGGIFKQKHKEPNLDNSDNLTRACDDGEWM